MCLTVSFRFIVLSAGVGPAFRAPVVLIEDAKWLCNKLLSVRVWGDERGWMDTGMLFEEGDGRSTPPLPLFNGGLMGGLHPSPGFSLLVQFSTTHNHPQPRIRWRIVWFGRNSTPPGLFRMDSTDQTPPPSGVLPPPSHPGAGDRTWARSVRDIDGEVLLVSQFTLMHVLKGNKPARPPREPRIPRVGPTHSAFRKISWG